MSHAHRRLIRERTRHKAKDCHFVKYIADADAHRLTNEAKRVYAKALATLRNT